MLFFLMDSDDTLASLRKRWNTGHVTAAELRGQYGLKRPAGVPLQALRPKVLSRGLTHASAYAALYTIYRAVIICAEVWLSDRKGDMLTVALAYLAYGLAGSDVWQTRGDLPWQNHRAFSALWYDSLGKESNGEKIAQSRKDMSKLNVGAWRDAVRLLTISSSYFLR